MKKTSFFQKVYKVVKKIPHGKVTSYGAIAKYLGTPRSSSPDRGAMNACHNDKSIPAHRVVNRNGVLTGKNHFLGINLMEQLLNSEGIDVKDDKIVNFKNHFWDPNI